MNYKGHLAITGLLFKVMTLVGAYYNDLNIFYNQLFTAQNHGNRLDYIRLSPTDKPKKIYNKVIKKKKKRGKTYVSLKNFHLWKCPLCS